ncbi:hypothetical protein [uncultured Brevibacillus sp.]|uniref:hypothetical protein n=1 Tax=uncultured Brevibacillus sp. TaxID=169970 RepID=UPI00259A18E9|nr:hypothetical protein [uncultured Brevibacillus sp.]
MVIDLQRADFSPSATLLTLQTKLTPEGEPFMPYWLGQKVQSYDIAYELVDKNGKVVAAWDDLPERELSIEKNVIINGIHGSREDSVRLQLLCTTSSPSDST